MAGSELSVNVGCYHSSNSFVHLHLARNCIIFWNIKMNYLLALPSSGSVWKERQYEVLGPEGEAGSLVSEQLGKGSPPPLVSWLLHLYKQPHFGWNSRSTHNWDVVWGLLGRTIWTHMARSLIEEVETGL